LGNVSEHLGYVPDGGDFEMFIGEGCQHCSGTGYTGRIGIYELLVMSDPVSRAISKGMGLEDLKGIGKQEGFATMFQDGLKKVQEGKTSLAEVVRVGKGL
jgi:type II secretory ATPase GspE/PulE/Tfp pilus assembly ATPase PilB-like protein